MSAGDLARRQLEAYNRADVDAFCACYAPDVRVLDAEGSVIFEGAGEFRRRYAELFSRHEDVRAELIGRLACGAHAVDHERWSRRDRATGEISSGELLARYTERDGLIAVVQFLR